MSALTNLCKNFVTLFDKRKFFLKTLITFTAVLVGSIVIVFSVLLQIIKEPMQNTIAKSYQTFLNQIRSSTDAYILNQISSILTQNILTVGQHEEWNYFFTLQDKKSYDANNLYHVYQKLLELKTNHNFLHSIVIYNPYANIIVSSDQGVTFTDNHFQLHFNLKISEDFVRTDNKNKWITIKENEPYLHDVAMISYISSVPIMRTEEQFYGCMIFNLKMETLTQYYIDNAQAVDKSTYFILQNGDLIASSDYENQKNKDFSWINAYTESTNEGIAMKNGESIIWSKSEVSDWIYVYSIPSEQFYREIGRVTQHTMWFILVALILAVFFIYWAIKWLQKPILSLVARSISAKNVSSDELKDIDGIINHFSSRITELEGTLSGNESLIKNQLVLDILNGSISGMEEVKSRFSVVDVNFDYKYFTLIFTEINSETTKNINYKNKDYMFVKISEQLQEYWQKFGAYFSIRSDETIISILANNDKKYGDHFIPREINVGNNINIGICETVDDIMTLHSQFKKLKTYMQYSFIYNYGNIFTYKEIEAYESSSAEIPDTFFENIETLLKSGKTDDIKFLIKDVFTLIGKEGCSYEYTQSVLLQIINLLCKIPKDQKLINDSFTKSNLISNFYNSGSLIEFEKWLDELLDIYQEAFTQRNNDAKATFINSITDYIAENITEQLSLSSVAGTFGISQSHLSKSFKEILNINFSVYLNTKKFEAATEMLIKNRAMTVTEVAKKLGYYNMPYFNQQFKEKYGVSPLQYRKLHSDE